MYRPAELSFSSPLAIHLSSGKYVRVLCAPWKRAAKCETLIFNIGLLSSFLFQELDGDDFIALQATVLMEWAPFCATDVLLEKMCLI